MADLKSQEPTQTLDVLGRVCPYPLVITKKTMEKASNGTLLKVLCDAPVLHCGVMPSKFLWDCRRQPCRFLTVPCLCF